MRSSPEPDFRLAGFFRECTVCCRIFWPAIHGCVNYTNVWEEKRKRRRREWLIEFGSESQPGRRSCRAGRRGHGPSLLRSEFVVVVVLLQPWSSRRGRRATIHFQKHRRRRSLRRRLRRAMKTCGFGMGTSSSRPTPCSSAYTSRSSRSIQACLETCLS